MSCYTSDTVGLLKQYAVGSASQDRHIALGMLLLDLIEWCEDEHIDFGDAVARCCRIRAEEHERDGWQSNRIGALVVEK